MFTSELYKNAAEITILDDSGEFEDINLLVMDGGNVFIRQWDEKGQGYDVITMNYEQLNDLVTSLHNGPGVYHSNPKEEEEK